MHDDVTARLGTSGVDYAGTGALAVRATHLLWVKTEGKADAAGKSTAVGVDLAINAIVEWDTLAEIVATTQKSPPQQLGMTHGSTRTLARHLDVSRMTVARVWAEHDRKSWRTETFKVSTGPQLDAKVADLLRAVRKTLEATKSRRHS